MRYRFLLFVPAASAALALQCCNHPLTIYSKPVTASVSSNWAQTNIIDADAKGVLVTAEWIRVYHELYAAYGQKLPVRQRPSGPNEGISDAGNGRFRVTYEVSDRFTVLRSYDQP